MKTYFFDIDGTLIKKGGPLVDIIRGRIQAQEVQFKGMAELICEIHSRGDLIILTTARPESMRTMTVKMLLKLGFVWNQLIMSLANEERIVVNDYEFVPFEDELGPRKKAFAINVRTETNTAEYREEILNLVGMEFEEL